MLESQLKSLKLEQTKQAQSQLPIGAEVVHYKSMKEFFNREELPEGIKKTYLEKCSGCGCRMCFVEVSGYNGYKGYCHICKERIFEDHITFWDRYTKSFDD